MCTAVTYCNEGFYFGRNLDLEYHFGEEVAIMPRNYNIDFKAYPSIKNHYAMIGMAFVCDGHPLFAEAVNEKGLCMAGLNFPGFAKFDEFTVEGKDNITPYEIITWILAQCENLVEARTKLENMHLFSTPFKEGLGVNPLHWIVADKTGSLTVEASEKGLLIYDNPVGVLTNSPHFEYHMLNLNNYLGNGPYQPEQKLLKSFEMKPFGQGLGGHSIPGDFTPSSRFIKAVYIKENSNITFNENSNMNFKEDDIGFKEEKYIRLKKNNIVQFFHILDSVKVVKGSVVTPDMKDEYTIYSCCVDTEKGDYYYKTYFDTNIRKISMNNVDLDAQKVYVYPLTREMKFIEEN